MATDANSPPLREDDPLRIPEFLRRSENRETALRKEWESPTPRPTPIFSAVVPRPKPAGEISGDPVIDEARQLKKTVAENRFKRRIAAAKQRSERVPGSVWDTKTSRWVHPPTDQLRREEEIMAKLKGEKTVAQLTAEYNELAKARGLRPVIKFRDLATAKERLEKIQKATATPAASPKDEGSSTEDDVVKQFGFRKGSPREELVKVLLANLGQQVPAKKLGNLVGVMPGITWRIDVSNLPYALVVAKTTEGKTYGLHKREIQPKRT